MYTANANVNYWISLGVLVLVVLTALVAIIGAFLIWRNGYARGWRAARSNPPICLRCGYNLSGLTECRCPECGHEHRLEQLWSAAVRARAPLDSQQSTERPAASAPERHRAAG